MNEIVLDNKSFVVKVIKGTSKKTGADYYALVLQNVSGFKKYVSFKLEDIALFSGMNIIELVKSLG